MKKPLTVAVLAALLVLPTRSEASPVCFTGSPNGFFRIDSKSKCSPKSADIVAVHGRWSPGFTCNGRDTWGLHGTCFGEPDNHEVHINITSELLDPNDACFPVMWSMIGSAVNNASGVYDNAPFGSVNGFTTWTPAPCSAEPTPNAEVAPGPAPGRP
jgi:hypothetical protein